MANGEDGGEMALPTSRVGMKREFSMLMKAQAESGVTITPGRVTRSRLSSPSNGPLLRSGRVSSSKVTFGKGLNGKKMKKELENVVLDVVKLNGLYEIENPERKGSRNIVNKGVLISKEDQEQKNEVVFSLFADDSQGVTFQDDGPLGGEGKEVIGLENVCSDSLKSTVGGIKEPVGDIVERVNKRGKVVREDGDCLTPSRRQTRSQVPNIEEPVGGIVERVNNKRGKVVREDSDCLTPSRRQTRSISKSNVEAFESSRTGDESVCREKGDSVRRQTRSISKPNVEASESSRTGDESVGNEKRDSVKPFRRFTRSALNTSVSPSDMGKEKSKVMESDPYNPVTNSPKLEMKMSKKVELKNAPATLDDLLATCLLEGLHVHYAQNTEAGVVGKGLRGEIKGSGILCFCDECKGTQVVAPHQFEMHSGSGKSNPAEFTYLKNGNTLYDVLIGCKDAASDWAEHAIQISRGPVGSKDIPSVFIDGSTKCSSPNILKEPLSVPDESNDINDGSLTPGSPENSFVNLPSSSQSTNKSQRRVTRKDLRMHKVVFESDMLPDGTQLAYYCHGQKMHEGYKSGQGIYCNCCHEVVSASTFEAHAGFASRRKPYMYIYTSNGVSLHELAVEIKKSLTVSTDENDDMCSICEGTGELLCCDNCPRSFHKECIDLPSVPEDRWYCRYCVNMFQKDNFDANNINAVAAGRVAGIDAFEEIKKRCIRIVENLEPEDGGCVLCSARHFSKLGFGPRTVILCDQCEREFHIGCLKEHSMGDLQELPDEWFCCIECKKMHTALQQHLVDGEKILSDSKLCIVKKKNENAISEGDDDFKLSWRLLRGKIASEDDKKWLSGAVSVFHDRFDPIGHSSTRRNDLIPFMIYGRSNKQQDFGGMYCAVLLLNSKVISAGIFRIFGKEMAELPLVATSNDYQGKGYFQTLFGCIENLLTFLEVKDLVLPSATEAVEIWRNKFKFEDITDEQLSAYRKDYPMTTFQGTLVLHKLVPKPEISPTEASVE